ncbi:MAG TPA: alpha/beta hydrolase [Rhizomicrobium sp.]
MGTFLLRALLGLVVLLVAAAGAGLGWRAWRQHENAVALAITSPRGIDEQHFVRLGGIAQWISIRGEDRANPVILVMHGGPAMSYMAFTAMFQPWEKYFTVVQWDRRGSGKTYGFNGAAGSGTLTLDRIANDGIELAAYLRGHLHKKKIVLMGHSMGSLPGVMMAMRRPDLFHAYVGTDMIVAMAENEAESYRLMREALHRQGNSDAEARLAKIGPPPYAASSDWGAKQGMMSEADPAYRRVMRGYVVPALLTSPSYSLRDLYDFAMANPFSIGRLYPEWMAFDARRLGTDFRLPVVVLQGDSDLMAPTELAVRYFNTIHAPAKQIHLLKGVGHNSMFSAPERFLDELVRYVRPLAVEGERTVAATDGGDSR